MSTRSTTSCPAPGRGLCAQTVRLYRLNPLEKLTVKPNPEEVEATRWLNAEELSKAWHSGFLLHGSGRQWREVTCRFGPHGSELRSSVKRTQIRKKRKLTKIYNYVNV